MKTLDWLAFLTILALACTLAWVLARQVREKPPFYFTQAVYVPTQPQVCPGEEVKWRSQLIVTKAPTVVAVSRTLWSITQHQTIQADSQLDFYVWTEPERQKKISPVRTFLVPASLPAGVYEVRAGASAFNSDAAAYRVPFVVPERCFKGVN